MKYPEEFECPLIKYKCIGSLCMWWVVEAGVKDDCAIVKIAKELK